MNDQDRTEGRSGGVNITPLTAGFDGLCYLSPAVHIQQAGEVKQFLTGLALGPGSSQELDEIEGSPLQFYRHPLELLGDLLLDSYIKHLKPFCLTRSHSCLYAS